MKYSYNGKIEVKCEESCLKRDKTSFSHGKVVNLHALLELNMSSHDVDTDFVLGNALFGVVRLT